MQAVHEVGTADFQCFQADGPGARGVRGEERRRVIIFKQEKERFGSNLSLKVRVLCAFYSLQSTEEVH